MATKRPMGDQPASLASLSRRIHFIPATLATAPLIVLIAFLLFPWIETRNLGYPLFHIASVIAFALSGAGIAAWIVEQRFRHGLAAWMCLLVLAVERLGFAALRLAGDFYWAFERGFFLD